MVAIVDVEISLFGQLEGAQQVARVCHMNILAAGSAAADALAWEPNVELIYVTLSTG